MKCSTFFLKIEYFEDICNLKENLNSSVEMLGFFPVKYAGSREKLVMGKENWLKYVMQEKEKLERDLNKENDKTSKLLLICLYVFLNDSVFLKLQEYNWFHISDNVPNARNFPL